MRNHWRCHS